LKEELEVIKAKLLLKITDETEAGKPKYSNQNVREAALTIQLNSNSEAKSIKEGLGNKEDDIKRWEAHRDYYDKQFRITKDAVYYSFKNKEINDMRELSKSKAKEVLKYAPEE
jgi:hypothetical protein